MKKLKYPKYPRYLNLRCKLTDSDIKRIHALRDKGLTYKEIARHLKRLGKDVSFQAVWYWCLSPQKRKEKNKRWYILWGAEDLKDKHERQVRSVIRKLRLMPAFVSYHKQFRGLKLGVK